MAGEDDRVDGCCWCCFRFIITCGFTALFLWLSLRPHSPTLSIERFDVFALNETSNRTIPTRNHTIFFTLKLKNRNKDKSVFYDALNLTFYYSPNRTLAVANATFPGFHQGHDKSAERPVAVEPAGTRWEAAAAEAVETNGSAVFRVDLATAIRYKIVFWKTKRRRLELGADLRVDRRGSLVRGKKGVKLTSGAGEGLGCYRARGERTVGVVSVLLLGLLM